ncbi:3-deoxy-D-manno-octulosonic acid transferase [Chondrinema litorale]|uniref:3-deoxy-D-manno-octulosonic acid transferase n=1 Tax=Chondrinema litorale TaxID=2994555 RepID=UPI002543BCEC|nr:glycosyltransferase N-terminal domain-containing protein [Chondrinema litorale]UZR95583.1 3-deoxy-D-manno-octulosonic acid transferase [Chondrinema litorale]
MGKLFYNLGVSLYIQIVRLVSGFNTKAEKFIEGRKELLFNLSEKFKGNSRPVVWFHCASLGEFEQARPVLERFKTEYPNHFVLLTFFSPSGYEVRKNYAQADYICYLPIDTAENAQKFVSITKPTIAFFVKYEFWHHYINQLTLNQIPVISFSAIFRKSQVFFKPYGNFYRQILHKFMHIFVQDEASEKLLKSIGVNNITIGGDTRFDRVKAIVDARKDIEIAARFKNGLPILVIGSSWPPDIELIANFYNNSTKKLKLIIAPHEIEESKVQRVINAFPNKSIVRFSQAENKQLEDFDILIIDNIGMLSSLYYYGEYAYIGGAFGTGLHNTLEAATYGVPVFFGPKYAKFREAIELVNLGGAFSVNTNEEFEKVFKHLFNDETQRKEKGTICSEYVMSNTGGTEKVIDFCKTLIK